MCIITEKFFALPCLVLPLYMLINLYSFLLIVDFIRLFIAKVGELSDEDKTHAVCQEAYNSTLANYHPWIVRKGAVVAMYALPTRGALLQKVHFILYVFGDNNKC